VKFRFHVPQSNVCDWLRAVGGQKRLTQRVGRRPGLELDWSYQIGDVDGWQFGGDVVSLAMHGWQILRKWITRREERPSELLAAMGVRMVRDEVA
jgi:hypothetical protein